MNIDLHFLPIFAWLVFASANLQAHSEQALEVGYSERLLVLAPHPDDETLSAGGLINQVFAHRGTVRVVIVTAGDAYVDAVIRDTGKSHPKAADFLNYGEKRLQEAERATQILGSGFLHLDLLGFSDGSIYPMLVSHWRRSHPDKSPFTGFSHVPYSEAEDKGIAQDGADLRKELLAILNDTKPTLIVFPDVMENDSDHAGLGMFALLAINDWLANSNSIKPVPRLLSYLIHWRDNWPPGSEALTPFDLSDQPLYLPDDLPLRGHTRTCLTLNTLDKNLKRDALAQYQTQQRAMGSFLSAFVRSTECFSLLKTTDGTGVKNIVDHWQHIRKVFDPRPIARRKI